MIQTHHSLALAMQRPKSPALGSMGPLNPSAMSPRHMSSMARHLGAPTSPRHMSPRNMSPRNNSSANASPPASLGGGL